MRCGGSDSVDSITPVGAAASRRYCLAPIIGIPLPERRWQVPRSILHQAPNRAALGFGFELGLGFRTYVTASAPYRPLVALLLLAEPLPLFLLAGAAFGLGRLAMAAARYVGADGDASGGLVAARGALVRGSSAVVAAPERSRW